MVRRTVALLGLVTLPGIAAPAAAQDIPECTPDQRWARAEYLANGWFVLGVRYAKTMGQSVGQFAQAVFEVYDRSASQSPSASGFWTSSTRRSARSGA